VKIVKVVVHPDDVSGIYHFDDGTKMYWTEGDGNYVIESTSNKEDSAYVELGNSFDGDAPQEEMDAGDVEDFRIKMGWDE
jgi:hypothetical protein